MYRIFLYYVFCFNFSLKKVSRLGILVQISYLRKIVQYVGKFFNYLKTYCNYAQKLHKLKFLMNNTSTSYS